VGYLGPQQSLISSREEKERQEKAAKFQPRDQSVKALSEEEKQRRLQEMQQDASRTDEMRYKRVATEKVHAQEEAAAEEETNGSKSNASFLKEMRNAVYNTSEATMEERLQTNKHYTQKGTDLDAAGFMRK